MEVLPVPFVRKVFILVLQLLAALLVTLDILQHMMDRLYVNRVLLGAQHQATLAVIAHCAHKVNMWISWLKLLVLPVAEVRSLHFLVPQISQCV
jgi:hypothetical protein